MQALSLQPQYCETEQTSLLYKIIKLLAVHYSNVKTDQYSLAVEVQCPGKNTDSGQLHSRVYSHVACCVLGCYLLWFK